VAKRTPNRLLTDAFREIKNTRSRFISLMVLSALAVCFLAGLRATAPDMKRSADLYLDAQKLMDLRIVGTLGLTEEDAQALEQRPGITAFERAYTVDAILHLAENDYIVKAHSYTADPGLNTPELVEGRLPQGANECVVEPLLLQETGLKVGDSITLDTGTGNFEDALPSPTFTIVGTANSPLYVGVERGSSSLGTGKVSAFVLLPFEAFDLETYTDFYLQVEGAEELLCYSDDYEDLMDAFQDQLEPFADERAKLRGEEILSEANEALADAEIELADAEAEAAQEIADAEIELADARKELDDGWEEYYDGLQELRDEVAEAEQEIADAEVELADALVELQDGEVDLADARVELDDGWVEYYDGLQEYQDGWLEYQDGKQEYEEGLLEYQDGVKKLKDAHLQLQMGEESLSAGASQISAGWKELEQSEAMVGQMQQQLEAANQGIDQLQDALGALDFAPPSPETDAMKESLSQQLGQAIAGAQMLQGGIKQAEDAIKAGKEELANAERELESGSEALDAGWKTYSDGVKELEDAAWELEQAKDDLAEARMELENARIQLENAWNELNDGEVEYADGIKELEDGWVKYNDGLVELADAKQTLKEEVADAEAELADAYIELTDGEQEYADGLIEFEDGKAEAEEKIADAHKELEQARRDLEELDDSEWYLLGRNTNMGYMSYSMDADRMGNLASVFPLIFFLVAALVCLTTMTRMVEEQRTTIGGLKALGYSKGAIAIKYVGYGFVASAVGSVLGLAVGLTLIPWIICTAWGIIYETGPIHYGLEPFTSAVAFLAATGTVTLSALGACFSTLTAVPAQLMRPKAPPMGKRVLLERIPAIWNRLSFNYKITIRNLFRYKKRFWMTVIGIGGCAALIVTAFGLKDSIFDIMDTQFDEIYTHSAHIGLVESVTPGELREVEQLLEESELVEGWLSCRSENVTAETEVYTVDATLQVFESQQAVAPFISLRHRTDNKPVVLPDDGVVLNEKLAKLLDVQAGDTFLLDGEKRVEVRVADITEHYIQHYIYMTQTYYQTLFGAACENNLVLADYPIDSPHAQELEMSLVALDGVTSLSRIEDTRKTFSSSLASVDYAVILVIVCAAALAFVVLYNLTNINITERMRELATLKVLGFYNGELSAYVYRENVILTVFGVALGMVMGKLLHQWLILTVEIDLLMFGRVLDTTSYLYSILLTVIFSLVVNLAAHWKLKKLDMVESLKTVE